MSQINISNLTFEYDGSYDRIFDNVSFTIDTNWRLGFIGRNGRGKTTFLKLLMGSYEYRGTITANVGFEYFPFDVRDSSPTATTLDIAYKICPYLEQWELERELDLMDFDTDKLFTPYKIMSPGEQTKLMLAVLFLKENRFLLIDEPTNHLDSFSRRIVSDYLKSKKGFILVSHDRNFVDNCVDHILSINRSNIELQQGNFSSWYENRTRQDTFELSENEKLLKEIDRLNRAAQRSARWSDKAERSKIGFDPARKEKSIGLRSYEGEKSRKLMQQSKNYMRRKQDAAESKSKLLKNLERSDSLKLEQLEHFSNTLVYMSDVSVSYGTNTVCSNVGFTIRRGDRLAIKGRNGSGKSSIIKLICGREITYTGVFKAAGGLVISYVSQDTGSLHGSLSDYARSYGINESLFKAILNKLDFKAEQFDKDISDHSEGQKKKVLIARSLCEKAHLHIWDEPLNFIDVVSRIQIEELIIRHQPTMIFVEHDEAFCRKIATKEISL